MSDAPDLTPQEVVLLAADADQRLLVAAAGLTADEGSAATALPGWTRAHVLAHLMTLAEAFIRQTEHAVAGTLVPVYDGGRPARAQAIEEGSRLPWDTLITALDSRVAALGRRWRGLDPRAWSARVTYREATLTEVLTCWWREASIHLVDLDVGFTPQDWTFSLDGHLIGFFTPRLPAGRAFTLRPDDIEQVVRSGSGEASELRGPASELAGWLAGRASGARLRVVPAAPLPSLADTWP